MNTTFTGKQTGNKDRVSSLGFVRVWCACVEELTLARIHPHNLAQTPCSVNAHTCTGGSIFLNWTEVQLNVSNMDRDENSIFN